MTMDRGELRRLLKQQPFAPFRVYVADGRILDIRHPRMNLLAETFIKIGVGAPDLAPPLCDHMEYVRLKDILRVETLPPRTGNPTDVLVLAAPSS